MLMRNASALLGPGLEYADSACVRVEGGVFGRTGTRLEREPGEETVDCEGLLMLPGFVNCHTHVGDSVAKDAALGMDLDASVHPVHGAKARVLGGTSPRHLADFMRASCRAMLAGGVTTFADFREGGAEGAKLLREACRGLPIRAVVLGRTGADGATGDMPERCDGVGISGANEHTDSELDRYSRVPKLRAIHAAESVDTVRESVRATGRGEVERALRTKPSFLVHMGAATDAELRGLPPGTGIVACPRANAVLTGRIPDIPRMAGHGAAIGLGTDNVMVNPPDMFREMEFAWKGTGCRLSPLQILRMATVNGGRILRMRVGVIERGAAADFVLVERRHADIEPMHRPHAAMVHRASAGSIRAVVVGGRVAHGRI